MTRKSIHVVRLLPFVVACLLPLLPLDLTATERSEKRAEIGGLVARTYLFTGQKILTAYRGCFHTDVQILERGDGLRRRQRSG